MPATLILRKRTCSLIKSKAGLARRRAIPLTHSSRRTAETVARVVDAGPRSLLSKRGSPRNGPTSGGGAVRRNLDSPAVPPSAITDNAAARPRLQPFVTQLFRLSRLTSILLVEGNHRGHGGSVAAESGRMPNLGPEFARVTNSFMFSQWRTSPRN
jgi:hypothetical protein